MENETKDIKFLFDEFPFPLEEAILAQFYEETEPNRFVELDVWVAIHLKLFENISSEKEEQEIVSYLEKRLNASIEMDISNSQKEWIVLVHNYSFKEFVNCFCPNWEKENESSCRFS